jgi:hypothetical protein
MVYSITEAEVYVFCYDTWVDTSCIRDYYFSSVEDAEVFCMVEFNAYRWVDIEEPLEGCQHDHIHPTKLKRDKHGNPLSGKFQTLLNGNWIDTASTGDITCININGTTGNERLYLSGLMGEFDIAMKFDKVKAGNILRSLKWDEPSIDIIVNK